MKIVQNVFVSKSEQKEYEGKKYSVCQVKNLETDRYYTAINSKVGVEVPEGNVTLEMEYGYNKFKKRYAMKITAASVAPA